MLLVLYVDLLAAEPGCAKEWEFDAIVSIYVFAPNVLNLVVQMRLEFRGIFDI